MAAGKASEHSTLYEGSYDRPISGSYNLSLLLNGNGSQDSHGLPLIIKSVDGPYTFEVHSFELRSLGSEIPIGDELSIIVQVHDRYGSGWKLKEEDPCKGWKLQAEAYWSNGRLVNVPPIQLGTLVPEGAGHRATYVVPGVRFTEEFNYYLKLSDAQGNVLRSYHEILVSKRRALTSLIVSGDGLLSGFSNSRGMVTAEAFDQYGSSYSVENSLLAWTITTSDGVLDGVVSSVSFARKGRFLYQRPATTGTSLRYFLRIALVTPTRTLEAVGSPFLLHSANFFSDIDFSSGSFWYKDNTIQRLLHSTLVLRDQFNSLAPSPSSLIVEESTGELYTSLICPMLTQSSYTTDYTVDIIAYKGSGTFEMSYTVKNPSGSLSYYLNGTPYSMILPVEIRPTWEPVRYEYLEVAGFWIQTRPEEQVLAMITSEGEVHLHELQVMIYGNDLQHSSFCCLAKVEASKTEPYTYLISGNISTGKYLSFQINFSFSNLC